MERASRLESSPPQPPARAVSASSPPQPPRSRAFAVVARVARAARDVATSSTERRRSPTARPRPATTRQSESFGDFGTSSLGPSSGGARLRPERRLVSAFRSMGCEIVLPDGAPLDAVRALFDERDAASAAFARPPSSTASTPPPSASRWSRRTSRRCWPAHSTRRAPPTGCVTPAVGGAIIAAGYDRDFAELPFDGDAVEPVAIHPVASLSLRGRMLLRSAPVVLDLNGVVKGTHGRRRARAARDGWVCGRRRPRDDRAGRGRSARRRLGSLCRRRPRDHRASRTARWLAGAGDPAPPDRPSDRPAGRHAVARRHGRGRQLPRRGRRREGRAAPRRQPGPRGSTQRGLAGRFVATSGDVDAATTAGAVA